MSVVVVVVFSSFESLAKSIICFDRFNVELWLIHYIKSEITAKFFYKKTQYSVSYKSFRRKTVSLTAITFMSEYRNKKK